MKLVSTVALSFIGVLCTAFAGEVGISANATLKDGSVVKGEFLTKTINGSTLFSKTLALDSEDVRSLAFSNTNGEAKVELVNGDKFAIKVADPTLTVKSLLGELKIPRENFRSITLSKKKKGRDYSLPLKSMSIPFDLRLSKHSCKYSLLCSGYKQYPRALHCLR